MSWFRDLLSLGEDDEELQERKVHEVEELDSNKPLVKAVAEDIEHELDELADGFLNLVGQAANLFSSNNRSQDLEMVVPLTVGIIGSSTYEYEELAQPLARWLAKEGFNLLIGEGKGVMAAASKAFVSVSQSQRRGRSIGIISCSPSNDAVLKTGCSNPWVEIPIFSRLLVSEDGSQGRNMINILSSDIVICFPGSFGTRLELMHALSIKKPVCIFIGNEENALPDLAHVVVPKFKTMQDVKKFVVGSVHDILQRRQQTLTIQETDDMLINRQDGDPQSISSSLSPREAKKDEVSKTNTLSTSTPQVVEQNVSTPTTTKKQKKKSKKRGQKQKEVKVHLNLEELHSAMQDSDDDFFANNENNNDNYDETTGSNDYNNDDDDDDGL
eukprot:m.58894 g.58894  ORF g.58894 m.58894 type:complete len:385 (-) comp7887_c0_seq2:1097-2251(-)